MAKGIAIRVQPNVLERLKELGEKNCRTAAQTIEWLVRRYDEEEETLEEYVEREKPYIEHALKQPRIKANFEDVFRD